MHLRMRHARLLRNHIYTSFYLGNFAFQDHGLHAAIMIQVHMLRSDNHIMAVAL